MRPSFDLASSIYDWANICLIGALIVGAASTILVVWMGNVKEADLQRDLAASKERLAAAELGTEQLRRLAGPRGINQEAFSKALEGKPKSPVQIWYLPEIPDGFWFANQLVSALIAAHWDILEPPTPIRLGEPDPNDKYARYVPPLMALGAQPSGITVVAHGVPADIDKDHSSWSALVNAIAVGMGTSAAGGFNASVPEGVLRVIIAAKPDPIFPTKPEQTAPK
jgi:hypothetical protein